MTSPKLLPTGHPDRALSAQEVIEPHYQTLVSSMKLCGMSEGEIAVAIEELAQAHLIAMMENRRTEARIAAVREEAGLEPILNDDLIFAQLERDEPPNNRRPLVTLIAVMLALIFAFNVGLYATVWLGRFDA